jgi:predicted ATP-dependent endonuclease of OLD family
MKLISSVKIERFRSIAEADLDEFGNFTALAGLNNSGKSNVLRALNAFFSGHGDPGRPISIESDYHRQYLKRKKAKKIRVAVRFSLPNHFTFRRGLEPVREFLGGATFEVEKEWNRQSASPDYFLNGGEALDANQRAKIDQFLSLISFRYIPNRVLPLDVIRNEHQSLRDVLIRRLARKAKNPEAAFKALQDTSVSLVERLAQEVHDACPGVNGVRLSTPSSWQDMVFAFGYKLVTGDVEIDDTAQGSGVQSLLMFQTLSLKFGWKQAAVWAVEEPESSLHSSLEARVASYLASVSIDPSSRLQIVTTTHSDLMLQYSDRPVFVVQSAGETKFQSHLNKRMVLEQAAKLGISRWVHPILAEPLSPIVLVEGKYDEAFVNRALRLLGPSSGICVRYLEQLEDGATGGVDHMLRYIKTNAGAVRMRAPDAPVIVLLDWDSEKKKNEFLQPFHSEDPFHVLVWPQTAFNPKLGATFRGIERHMPDRFIAGADVGIGIVATKPDGTFMVERREYPALKEKIFSMVEKDLKAEDLIFVAPFIKQIMAIANPEA